MTKEQIEKWAREEGRTLPRLKSNRKYGFPGSSALDMPTWEESYNKMNELYPRYNYPKLNE